MEQHLELAYGLDAVGKHKQSGQHMAMYRHYRYEYNKISRMSKLEFVGYCVLEGITADSVENYRENPTQPAQPTSQQLSFF
jgi:hypothetical protein